jgi:1,4-dihydroxy-2-naphthoate octaprenyltransferase
MGKMKIWLSAFRLRTLPLSLSGIIAGSMVALRLGYWNGTIFALALFTTIFLQILSNLANDLGDHLKGTDNENRVGPERATQSGAISSQQMKTAVVLFSILSVISAGLLIFVSASEMSFTRILSYVGLGIGAVIAALMYTLGKKAYGYNGLGDVFVFIFFGLVSVIGVFGLYSPFLYWKILLPLGIGVGLLSVAVLNLNNMRDHENDAAVNKRTVVVKMGFDTAKSYHASLILGACFAFVYSTFHFQSDYYQQFAPLTILLCIPLLSHLKRVIQTNVPKDLDPELKKVALNTFAIVLVFSLLINLPY